VEEKLNSASQAYNKRVFGFNYWSRTAKVIW